MIYSEVISLIQRWPQTLWTDCTSYARFYGYRGSRRVIVSDGRVISHCDADWFEWISNVRQTSANL